MPHEIAALFIHHANDAATHNNLNALRKSNPALPIVPISNWGVTLPGGHHIRDMAHGWRRLLPSFRGNGMAGAWRRFRFDLERTWIWRNSDLIAYFYILWPKREVFAKRWLIFEWDMYCNTSVHEYYAGNLNDPLVATTLQVPGVNDDFYFFNDREHQIMPPTLHPFRMATVPWAGMLIEDGALRAIAERVRQLHYCNGFCELRVATVASSLGYTPAMNANPAAMTTLRAMPMWEMSQISGQGIWHRVKNNV